MTSKKRCPGRSISGGKISQGAVAVLAACGNAEILMQHTRRWIALGLLLAAPGLLAQSAPPQNAAPQNPVPQNVAPPAPPQNTAAPAGEPHHKSPKAEKELTLPPLPAGPLSQLPMDQIPASPATVSYEGGLLTISAQNSTLGEILRDVRKLTGASIEIPPGLGGNERVVAHLGPGSTRDVLVLLLNGSSFNYMMLGSSTDPSAVSSVILTPKPSGSSETQTAVNVSGNNPGPPNRFSQPQPLLQQSLIAQPRNGNAQPVNTDSDDSNNDDQETADDSAADDQTQPGQPVQPATPDANAQAPQPPDANQPNAGPRTPEQVLELLRNRQQQPGGAAVPAPQPPQPPQE